MSVRREKKKEEETRFTALLTSSSLCLDVTTAFCVIMSAPAFPGSECWQVGGLLARGRVLTSGSWIRSKAGNYVLPAKIHPVILIGWILSSPTARPVKLLPRFTPEVSVFSLQESGPLRLGFISLNPQSSVLGSYGIKYILRWIYRYRYRYNIYIYIYMNLHRNAW